MATAIIDHQPQATGRIGLAASSSTRERNWPKPDNDLEAAVPPEQVGPPVPPSTRDAPSPVESRQLVLHRVPTYLQPSLPWRDRLIHFTFAWYTVT